MAQKMDIVFKRKPEKKVDKKAELIDYLRKGINDNQSWVYRKEIAAWASVLLFFSVIYGFIILLKKYMVIFIFQLVL